MHKPLLVALSVFMLATLGFAVACGEDEPSQEEARAALCGDLEQLDVAITTFMELDTQSTIGEVRAARDDVTEAADDVVGSAEDVEGAEIAALQQAAHNLHESIDNIQDDQTVQEVLDMVSASAQELVAAQQQVYADLSCEGATPTGEAVPTDAATEPATEGATVEPTAAETEPAETAAPTDAATETVVPDETPEPTDAEPTLEGV